MKFLILTGSVNKLAIAINQRAVCYRHAFNNDKSKR